MAEELGFKVGLKHKKINISNPRVSTQSIEFTVLVTLNSFWHEEQILLCMDMTKHVVIFILIFLYVLHLSILIANGPMFDYL